MTEYKCDMCSKQATNFLRYDFIVRAYTVRCDQHTYNASIIQLITAEEYEIGLVLES